MLLRDYQLEAIEAIRTAFRKGKKRILVEMATGLGKTIIFSHIARMAREKGGKILILCNRDNLIVQAADKYYKTTGDIPSTEQADLKASRMAKVVIGSIQSMQGKRLASWAKDHFAVVILDECHGGTAKTFRNILSHFDSCYHIGFSATIERHNQNGIGWFYEEICYRMGIYEGIERGWLVPLIFEKLAVPVLLDERLAKKKHLTEADEEFSLEPYLTRLIETLADKVTGRKALLFFPTCKPSEAAAQKLRENGIDARHVDSTYLAEWETDNTLRWFDKSASGTTMCNANLLTTGYDNPSVDTIGVIRIIKSTPLFTQIIGRGTRTLCNIDDYKTPEERKAAIAASAKPNCTILDLFIQGDNHDIASPSCLISTLKEERKAIDAKVIKFNKPVTLDGMRAALDEKKVEDANEALRKVAEQAANAAERVTKAHQCYIGHILYQQSSGKPASEKQLAFIKSLHGDLKGRDITAQQGCRIIDALLKHKQKLREREMA